MSAENKMKNYSFITKHVLTFLTLISTYTLHGGLKMSIL